MKLKRSHSVHLREISSTLAFFQHVTDCSIVVLILYVFANFYLVSWTRYYTYLSLFSFFACFLSFHAFNLYRSWRSSDLYKEFIIIIKAWGTVVGLVLFILFFTKTSINFSRFVLMAWFFISPFAIYLVHAIGRVVLREARSRGLNIRRIILVGDGSLMEGLCRHISEMHWAGIKVVGYFDDSDTCATLPGETCPHLGRIKDVPKYLRTQTIDYVYIALSLREEETIKKLISSCRTLGAKRYLVPDLYTYGLLNARMETFGELLLLNFNPDFRMKRYFDVTFSIFALIFTLPISLVIMLLIKMQDGGPIFYGHKRVTEGGKSYRCLKFRTMVVDADKRLKEILANDPVAAEEWEKTFKLKSDPRITWIGRFLRRTSLDELPQFINVLKGEMSVVGARPIVAKELQGYYKENGGLYCSLKPGITGPWQVSIRSDTENYQDRVDMDTWYVLNQNLWLDIKIIIRTVFSIFNRKGAY